GGGGREGGGVGSAVRETTRLRREPPAFRRVAVRRVERLTPRMVRVTVAGAELAGLVVEQPAASVRVLLPSRGSDDLVVPEWNGNEFLLPDGRRPAIRTFTPWRVDTDDLELDVGIVVHGGGVASQWAQSVRPGDPAAISGPGRGYGVADPGRAFLGAGDETALRAMTQVLGAVPDEASVQVRVEIGHADGRLEMPAAAGAETEWCALAPAAAPGDALGAAVRDAELTADTRVWAAGEAAAVHPIPRQP